MIKKVIGYVSEGSRSSVQSPMTLQKIEKGESKTNLKERILKTPK